jgi:CBS domain-containing protein
MDLTARDVMQADVQVVSPDKRVTDLDRDFLARQVGGFPVVDAGRLVGIVSRSDVVRQLCVEQSLAENISDYYRERCEYNVDPVESLAEIGARVGARIEMLRVRDVMSRKIISVSPQHSLREVGLTLTKHGVHRVPVTEGGRLLGIVTTLDLVRLVAESQTS